MQRCAMSMSKRRLEQELGHLVVVQSDLAQRRIEKRHFSDSQVFDTEISMQCSPGVLSLSDSRAAIHQSFPRLCHVATLPRFFTVPMTSATTRPSPLPRKTTSTEKSMESVGQYMSILSPFSIILIWSKIKRNHRMETMQRRYNMVTWYSYT